MEKNRKKVIRKIKRFYQRDRKTLFFKVTNEMLNDVKSATMFINHKKNRLDKHPAWCRDISVEIGLDRDDFAKNRSTVRIDYTYPKPYKP
jgi:hypothetical protein